MPHELIFEIFSFKIFSLYNISIHMEKVTYAQRIKDGDTSTNQPSTRFTPGTLPMP